MMGHATPGLAEMPKGWNPTGFSYYLITFGYSLIELQTLKHHILV